MRNSIKTLKITLHSHFNALTPFYFSYSTSSFFSSFSSPVSSSLFSFGTTFKPYKKSRRVGFKEHILDWMYLATKWAWF